MEFTIQIEPEVYQDIQAAISWYEEKQQGLGERFFQTVFQKIENLKINPFYQIRYKNFRCLPLQNFPYMIHFSVNEESKIVTVSAVLSTHIDNKKWGRNK